MPNQQFELYQQLLKKNGLKDTKPRREVFYLLLATHQPLTAVELVTELPAIDQSSIYRSLKKLQQAGIIKAVTRGFKTYYELSEHFFDHHHHLVCERCGRVIGLQNEELEKLITKLSRQAGMIPTAHQVELFGICRDCQLLKLKRDTRRRSTDQADKLVH